MKKTNKTFKRFAAITSASLLAACAVAPVAFNAFAAPSTIEITNTNTDAAVHKYEAYQIFEGVMSDNKLTEIDWGTGIDSSKKAELLEALAAKNTQFAKNLVTYTIAEDATATQDAYDSWNDGSKSYKDYYDYLKGEGLETTGITITCDAKSAEKIADVLSTATLATDDPLAKDFAEVVGKYLSTEKTDSVVVSEDQADDTNGLYAAYEKDDIIIPGLDDGYYLIQDAATSPGNTVAGENSGAKTRFILKVTNNATLEVNAKASAPTVMKKVQEDSLIGGADEEVAFAGNNKYNPGDGYNDVADYAIGDDVPFKLYGTMPSTLDDYDHYYYKFTDTLGEEFDKPTNVKITIGDTALYYKPVNTEVSQGVVKWVYTQYDETFTTAITENKDNNCSLAYDGTNFTIEFKDIKKYTGVDKNTVVTVDYNAVLNESAKIGYEGQLNKVDLTYSNNPNEEYKPWNEDGTSSGDEVTDKGTTKEDGVIVFTYGFDINKYENGDFADKLAGAKFAVYYLDESDNRVYIKTDDNNCYAGDLNEAPTAGTAVANANGVWESVETAGTNIVIKGLDVGDYYIEEIAPPAGYNPLAGPVKVTVASTIEKTVDENTIDAPIYTQDWTYSATGNTDRSAMDSITIKYADETVDVTDKLGTVNIENKAGTALPGTGGIGTTIFYLGGGAMAAIGGIYLISKRRMRKSEE